jgi:hypothetical protein
MAINSASEEIPATAPSPRVRHALCGLVVVLGAVLVGVSQLATSFNLPFAHVRVDAGAVLAIGSVATLLGLVSWKLPAEAVLTLASCLVLLVAMFALGYRPIKAGDLTVHLGQSPRAWQSETEWTELHTRVDQRFAWTNQPNAVARQVGRDFSVTYHTDSEGWRKLPAPTAVPPHGEIWFAGCSFTYGAEVEDEELYVHRLAKAWPGVRVRNFAVSGWGTTNALLALKEHLARQPKPDAVVYGWIGHHSKRNYLRKSWFGAGRAAIIPHFELDGGELRWRGMIAGTKADLEDGPALDEYEFRLTVALVREMARLARERGVPLVMLVLSEADYKVPDAVRGEPGLHVLDASRVSYSRHRDGDGHPTALWHQVVARKVASDPMLADLTGLRELHVPEAIAAPAMGSWGLERDLTDKSATTAAIAYPAQPGQPLRVTFSGKPAGNLSTWSLKRSQSAVTAGNVYAVELRVRSDGTRPLQYALTQGQPPWKNLGLEGTLMLTPEWQQLRRFFVATHVEANSWLVLNIGGSTQSVELAEEPRIRELSGAEATAARKVLARAGWKLSVADGAQAILDFPSADPGPPFRARMFSVPDADVWKIQLQHASPMVAGKQYTFELRARSARPRSLEYAVSQDRAPWENLGLWGRLALTPDWQTVRRTFVATRDDAGGRVILAIGGNTEPVEIGEVRLADGERELLP